MTDSGGVLPIHARQPRLQSLHRELEPPTDGTHLRVLEAPHVEGGRRAFLRRGDPGGEQGGEGEPIYRLDTLDVKSQFTNNKIQINSNDP